MQTLYKSKLFGITRNNNGFEYAERSPGVRLLIVKGKKILLTKEYRTEVRKYDYRLPGGKIFDTFEEYQQGKQHLLKHAITAAKRECQEETGLIPLHSKHLSTAHAGATIIWDLYYFLVDRFNRGKQKLGKDEDIVPEWKTFAEVKKLCLTGQIAEDRTVGVLLRFLMGGFSADRIIYK